jgi:hypothetical protein
VYIRAKKRCVRFAGKYFFPLTTTKIIPPITNTTTVIKIPMPTPVLKIAPITSQELSSIVKKSRIMNKYIFRFFIVV